VLIITRRPEQIVSAEPIRDTGFEFGVRVGNWSYFSDDKDPPAGFYQYTSPEDIDFICVVSFTFSTPIFANCVNTKDPLSATWLQLQFNIETNCDVDFLLSTSMSFGDYTNDDPSNEILDVGTFPFRFTATNYCRKADDSVDLRPLP